MQEMQIRSPRQEDPLEEEMATHPVFLPGKLLEQRSLAGVHEVVNSQTLLSAHTHTHTHTQTNEILLNFLLKIRL